VTTAIQENDDGRVPTPERLADTAAIEDLAVSYGFAIDDGDWTRWRALFTDDAQLDYTHSGGISGPVDDVAAWMPEAISAFRWSLHSILTHEVRFTAPDTASGRVHLFNRNGIDWNGTAKLCDVGGLYLDEYRRIGTAGSSPSASSGLDTSPAASSPLSSAPWHTRRHPTSPRRWDEHSTRRPRSNLRWVGPPRPGQGPAQAWTTASTRRAM
jgi:hypothetical protein